MIKYKKKFLIIGNQNAISYKEIFDLIKDNKIWLGMGIHSASLSLCRIITRMREVRSWRDENGTNWRSFGNACWFTNLDIAKRHEELVLYKNTHLRNTPSTRITTQLRSPDIRIFRGLRRSRWVSP